MLQKPVPDLIEDLLDRQGGEAVRLDPRLFSALVCDIDNPEQPPIVPEIEFAEWLVPDEFATFVL